jgi:glycosyltransferase involved in cell wall biosynthesis
MNLLDAYYRIKPLIPRRLQLALRRRMVLRKLPRVRHTWPIDPGAGQKPDNWPGWPDGKQFALVLTHDVETQRGLEKVFFLAKLEQELGFRSCFNFVGRDYPVPDQLRHTLTDMGFEVGLHGLTHKGNLFRSRQVFERHLPEINKILWEWNAVGFRSPSMYHHLAWIGELNIEYDMSTFDTDPFEPQPDGLGTIFPFWFSAESDGRGYIELPYTLPQDHSLYVLIGEKDCSTWKRKLDWIAEKGGMALINAHPDYMGFSPGERSLKNYPVEIYKNFLEYAKKEYDGRYWHGLPREIAQFIKENPHSKSETSRAVKASGISEPTDNNLKHPAIAPDLTPGPSTLPLGSFPTHRSLRVCMLSYSFYEIDARVTRYAETLVRRGDQVDVIAIGREGSEDYSLINGVHVYRIQHRERDERGKMVYLSRILKFLFRSSAFLNSQHKKNPYDLIHIHSVPDFEVFAAWLPKLKGARLILDIHDIVPELYAAKFGTSPDSIFYKFLLMAEKLSASFSDHVIISNHIWGEKVRRSVRNGKCTVILNYPDEHIYFQRPRRRSDGRFIMVYPGTLNWHQGLDIAVRAVAKVKNTALPVVELHIYGGGDSRESLRDLAQELGVSDRIIIHDPRPKEEIAAVMAEADLGIVPKRDDDFGGEAFSTKTLEFMSLGVPLLLAATKIDRYYFNDSVVQFFEPENVDDLAAKIMELASHPEERQTLAARALEFVELYKWENNKHLYLDLVDSLVRSKSEILNSK